MLLFETADMFRPLLWAMFRSQRKLYNISHKIYQSKIQQDLFVVQYSNALHVNHKRPNATVTTFLLIYYSSLSKGKVIPLQARCGPESG